MGFITPGKTAEDSLKYDIQSAFIYKFIKFIEWDNPKHGFDNGNICVSVLGKGAINKSIKKINGKEVKGKKIDLWFIESINELKECKVLFIPPESNFNSSYKLDYLSSKGVLTIGNQRNFNKIGGIINLVTIKNKINFEINLEQARKSNIKISSKLLQLARIVKNGNSRE
ncbi:MAG: DUF4154 domain-containing protein [Nitrosopumilaceae archaeon]|nr:DUF4154 domain-containing protein [Nitrosopumilaceae archaeon]